MNLTPTEKKYLDYLIDDGGIVHPRMLADLCPRSESYDTAKNLAAAHMVNLRRKVAGEYTIEYFRGEDGGYQINPV